MNFGAIRKAHLCIIRVQSKKDIVKLFHSSIKLNTVSTSVLHKSIIPVCSLIGHRDFSKSMACGSKGCGTDFSKEALKKKLTSIQYQVTQECDTERAFSGKYCKHFEKGVYMCVVCSQDIFSSESKYESKCGWPAFFDVINSQNVKLKNDLSHDMKRTEVSCSNCSAHLGHVFDDGPPPTGKRYCINSAALDFRKEVPESNSS